MNRDLKASSFGSPLGFNENSRGWSPDSTGTEPVVMRHHKKPNPVGVEQLSDSIKGAIYSTPTGSVKTATHTNHGFRSATPAAIIVRTPMGSMRGSDD